MLDPQNPIFSFRHNFTKKYFFSKVRLIPDSARSDSSKEPIKSGYLCKNAKKKVFRDNWSHPSGALYMTFISVKASTKKRPFWTKSIGRIEGHPYSG